ncbi:MAG: hypothetical protein M1524_01120 [Patescibacteria group bacterium]|nr:hypothetical protein [Patescibacteria group bacterium]
MKSKVLIIGVFAIFLNLAAVGFAQESTAVTNSDSVLEVEVSPKSSALKKDNIVETRKNFSEEIKEIRKEQAERIKEARVEFRQKLKSIRDERKKTLVENIDTKISNFNQNHTQKLSEALEKLQTILDKIKTKSENAKSSGLDTVGLEADIATAQSAIDNAETAISTQAAKQYSLEITSDETLKQTIGPTISQFRNDLQDVRKSVTDARQAVHKAATTLAILVNGNKLNAKLTPTPSLTQ